MSKDNLIERLHDEARELLAAEFEAAGNTQAVAVLRAGDPGETLPYQGVMLRAIEAALTRKQALIEEMVEGLRPFAEVAEHDIGDDEADQDIFCPMISHNVVDVIRVGALRNARSLITKATEGDCGL